VAADAPIRVEGLAELRRTLAAAGVDMSDFTETNKLAAALVATAARGTAPVGPPVGGHLASSIRPGATRTTAMVRVGNNTRFPYAGPIHWGWAARGIRANPWVSEAATGTEDTWLPKYMDRVDQIVGTVKGI